MRISAAPTVQRSRRRRQFVALCHRLDLFAQAIVAIDGSKFKAVNNRDKNFTVAKVAKRMEQVDASIARYLATLDRADREESDVTEAKASRIKEKIAGLRRQMQFLKEMERQVEAAADQQVSLTPTSVRCRLQRVCSLARPREYDYDAPLRRGEPRDEVKSAGQNPGTRHKIEPLPASDDLMKFLQAL